MTTGEDGGTDKLPWSRRRHRREGFKQYGREVLEALEFQEFQPDGFIVGGDTVVVLGHERCLVRATGRVVNANWAQIFTIHPWRSDLHGSANRRIKVNDASREPGTRCFCRTAYRTPISIAQLILINLAPVRLGPNTPRNGYVHWTASSTIQSLPRKIANRAHTRIRERNGNLEKVLFLFKG